MKLGISKLLHEDFCNIIKDIKYRDFFIDVYTGVDPPTGHYLQVRAFLPDPVNPEKTWQGGRKWRLSEHMTKSEVVQTCFKAILAFEEHETREFFMYRGKPIFGPHIDVDALHAVCHVLDDRKANLG